MQQQDWHDYIRVEPEQKWLDAGFTATEYRSFISALDVLFDTSEKQALLVQVASRKREDADIVGKILLKPSPDDHRGSVSDPHFLELILQPNDFRRSALYRAETGSYEMSGFAEIFIHELVHLTPENIALKTSEQIEAHAMYVTNRLLPEISARYHHGSRLFFDDKGLVLNENASTGVAELIETHAELIMLTNDTRYKENLSNLKDISEVATLSDLPFDGKVIDGLNCMKEELYALIKDQRVVHYAPLKGESGPSGTIDLSSKNAKILASEISELAGVLQSPADEQWTSVVETQKPVFSNEGKGITLIYTRN